MGSVARLKQTVVELLLEREDYFLVVVDPTRPGVVLPDYLVQARQPVGLNVGLRLGLPIPDLEVDAESLRGTLSFDRTPFHCTIPWHSLVQVSVTDEHMVWLTPRDSKQASPPDSPEPPQRPKLRVLK